MINMPYWGSFRITNLWGALAPSGVTYSAGYHTGIDLVGVDDKKIRCVCGGTVYRSAYDANGWGNYIVVKQTDGLYGIYCHLSSRYKTAGQAVATAEIIGVEGATGQVTGAHLHFELRKDYTDKYSSINPADYLGLVDAVGYAEELEDEEMVVEIEIELNGEVRNVQAIEKDGYNYIKLQSMRDDNIIVDYDATNKRPKITTI